MSLPERQWVARSTPDALETYLSKPDPMSRTRRAHTVWSDEFDNIIEPSLSDDAPGLSKTQLCRLRNSDSVNNRGNSDQSSSLLRGFRPSHLLFTDDCFVDGLVEGFGLILMAALMLAATVVLSVLIRRRISFWKLGRRHRSNTPLSRLSGPGRVSSEKDAKAKVVAFVEAV